MKRVFLFTFLFSNLIEGFSQNNLGFFGNKIEIGINTNTSLAFRFRAPETVFPLQLKFNPFIGANIGFVATHRHLISIEANYFSTKFILDSPYNLEQNDDDVEFYFDTCQMYQYEIKIKDKFYIQKTKAPIGSYISFSLGYGFTNFKNNSFTGEAIIDHNQIVNDTTYVFTRKGYKVVNLLLGYGRSFPLTHHLVLDINYELNLRFGSESRKLNPILTNDVTGVEEKICLESFANRMYVRYLFRFNFGLRYYF